MLGRPTMSFLWRSLVFRAGVLRTGCGARSFSSLPSTAKTLTYSQHGKPEEVVKLQTEQLPSLEKGNILVEMLAAPINPADINQIEGVYPVRPALPTVGGNEGLGRVVALGSPDLGLEVGDLVVPASAGLGTWRTGVVAPADDFMQVRLCLTRPIRRRKISKEEEVKQEKAGCEWRAAIG